MCASGNNFQFAKSSLKCWFILEIILFLPCIVPLVWHMQTY